MNFEQIGYNIKFFREQKEWTQQMLAEFVMVSRSTVAKWENNSQIPDIDILLKLSQLFDVTLDHLVGNTVYHEDLVKEFKRIYQSEAVEFDVEAIELVEYIMKVPHFKQQIHRLRSLNLKKQESAHSLFEKLMDEYEKL